MSASEPTQQAANFRSHSWQTFNCLLLTLIAVVSVYNFVRRGPTAFEWPGTDMACFYERLDDPTFLPNDYYTNSIVAANPRHVFGYCVVGIARTVGVDWYSVYFALRVIQTLAVPMLWYLAMLGLLKHYLDDERRKYLGAIVLAAMVVLVMRRDVSAWFSIAWWPPYFQYVGAHPLAVMLGLVGIVWRTSFAGRVRHLCVPIWFGASLIHPAIGLFVVAFYLLAAFDQLGWREIISTAILGALLPAAMLAFWFRPEQPLSANEFVDLYVVSSHPFHYQVAQFATLTKHPWWVSFVLVLALMLGGLAVGIRRADRPLVRMAIRFALAYSGCILLQYVGTDLWASRSIAALGPSRFSFLGFYMVAMLSVLAVCDTRGLDLARPRAKWHQWAPKLRALRPVPLTMVACLGAVAMVALLKDDLHHDVRAKHGGLYDWIEQNTSPDDIFLPTFNHALHKQLPVIGRRALFASQTFPFREEAIAEHIRRLTLAYGAPEVVARHRGRDQIAQRTNYFRSLQPDDFLAMARRERLDYIIVESDYREQFGDCPPCYRDDSIAVYRVGDFEKVVKSALGPNLTPPVTPHEARRSTLQSPTKRDK